MFMVGIPLGPLLSQYFQNADHLLQGARDRLALPQRRLFPSPARQFLYELQEHVIFRLGTAVHDDRGSLPEERPGMFIHSAPPSDHSGIDKKIVAKRPPLVILIGLTVINREVFFFHF